MGRTRPLLDESQDYKLLKASEVDGYTELMFERRRDTGDTNDLAFMVSMCLVYVNHRGVMLLPH